MASVTNRITEKTDESKGKLVTLQPCCREEKIAREIK